MPAISKDDYILLLFACIRNCKGEGQIDWKGVAQDTNLTANAATKRYTKLAKDHGFGKVLRPGNSRVPAVRAKSRPAHEEGEQGDSQEDSPRAKGKRSQTRSKGRLSKKRKMKHDNDSEEDSDGDVEQVDYDAQDVTPEEFIETEGAATEEAVIKTEVDTGYDDDEPFA